MSLNKITSTEISANNVKSVPGNKLTGTATENKNVFDKLVELLCTKFNSVVDALTNNGASEIGITSITGVSGVTVQAALSSLKALVDLCYTSATTDTLLNAKADNTVVNTLVKDVTFNENDGKFTITKQNGTTTVIDTLLEKVITNFTYDSTTQSLILTDKAGTQQSISLAEFITNNEFANTSAISFSVNSGVVSATINSNSITEDMIDSTIMSTMLGYKTSAQTSATNAAASEANALSYKNSASGSATSAASSATSASESAQSASASATSASQSEANALAYKNAAETAKNQAAAIVGGDYVTETELLTHTQNSGIHLTSVEKTKVGNLPTNTITELGNKVDKVSGKGLSANDYTNADKAKVGNLPDNTNSELASREPKHTSVTGTLSSGATSLTLTNSAITTSSTIDIYTSVFGVNPTAVTVSSGSVALTFDAQTSDVGVKVVIS